MPAHVSEVIGAVYELGITRGANEMAGERGVFDPTGDVSRAQMASFIMRTLNHTNLRPAGITAQQTLTSTLVSVRDADFKPVAGADVELFTTNYADDVFDERGECIDRYVSNSGFGFETGWEACQIDQGEQRTDDKGNHVFTEIGSAGRPTQVCGHTLEASGLNDPDAKYGIWAWTGEFGDIVDRDTVRAVPDEANDKRSLGTPARAVFSGGTKYDLKMGSDTLTYTIQLQDSDGDNVGPEPDVNRTFKVTTYVIDVDRGSAATVDLSTGQLSPTARKATETETPDSSGKVSIRIPHPDPNGPNADHSDVLVVVTVELGGSAQAGLPITDSARPTGNVVAGNAPGDGDVTVQIAGAAPAVALGAAVFSDDARVPSTYAASTRNWGRFSSTGNRNEVTLTLLDQYGDPYSGTSSTSYRFGLTPSGGTAVIGNVVGNGRARIVYTSPASVRSESVVIGDSVIAVEANTGTAGAYEAVAPAVNAPAASIVYWAEPGSGASGGPTLVYVADPAARSLVIESPDTADSDDPEFYVFGTDDTFTAEGVELSFDQFMEVLMAANNSGISAIRIAADTMLEWSSYHPSRPRDRAEWTLTGICG